MTYQLWIHKDVRTDLDALKQSFPASIENKVRWAQLQLTLEGRTPTVKSTAHHEFFWRRSPLRGFSYYLWWLPASGKGPSTLRQQCGMEERDILVRAIREHDENTAPLDLGAPEDYRQVSLADIGDPLYHEQKDIVEEEPTGKVTIRTVTGHPGSGKTVAIQYATSRLVKRESQPDSCALYVTYTRELANNALAFFDAHQLDKRVQVKTFGDVLNAILGDTAQNVGLRQLHEMQVNFADSLHKETKQTLGAWYDYQRELWVEIRAYLMGMALPYEWQRGGAGEIPASDAVLSLASYKSLRKSVLSDQSILEKAHKLAQKIANDEARWKQCFTDQYLVHQALKKLQAEPHSVDSIFPTIDTLVVDEVQDLTLAQIAVLAEIGRARSKNDCPLTLILAGDESQTVFPSGFDWGATKDLLYNRLPDTTPETVPPLMEQRRSPRRIHQVVNDSWKFYERYLPRNLRPRDGQSNPNGEDDESGTVKRWRMDTETDWETILRDLRNIRTDWGIIDLNNTFGQLRNELPTDCQEVIDLHVYSAASIKGLDRKTIFLIGVDGVVDRLQVNQDAWAQQENVLCALENRTLVDNLRVALSRSTETLIVAEQCDQVAEALNLSDMAQADWQQVLAQLRDSEKDVDALESIYNFLRNAEESLTSEDFKRAAAHNKEAHRLNGEVQDQELTQRIDDQRQQIDQQHLAFIVSQIEVDLNKEDYESAAKRHEEALRLAKSLKDKASIARLKDYQDELNFEKKLAEIEQHIDSGEYLNAFEQTTGATANYETRLSDLRKRRTEIGIKLKPQLKAIGDDLRDHAKSERNHQNGNEVGRLYRMMALARHQDGQEQSSQAVNCLADRYEQLSNPIHQLQELHKLGSFCRRYLAILIEVDQLKHSGACKPLHDWIGEMFDALTENPLWFSEVYSPLRELFAHDQVRGHHFPSNSKSLAMADRCVPVLRENGEIEQARWLLSLFEEKVPNALEAARQALNKIDEIRPALANLTPAERKRLLESTLQ